ncbi:MAG: energy transducer TonB [Bacteroidia bacterium]
MKKLILALAVILFFGLTTFNTPNCSAQSYTYNWIAGLPGFPRVNPPISAPDLRYEVRTNYQFPVNNETLSEAKLISDIVTGYPINWITSYDFVEILVTSKSKAIKAVSTSDVLTTEQKSLLNKIDMGTNIVVNVKYKYNNPFSNEIENNDIHTTITAVPDNQAEYVGGYDQMTKYLNEKGIKKTFEAGPKQFQRIAVGFTVNEQGEITNTKILTSSGDSKTDKLLIEAINKMPKWKPAENSNGMKVKQEFKFSFGMLGGDGC